MLDIPKKYQFKRLFLYFLLAEFVRLSGIMLLICYEWFITVNNITSIVLSQVLPIMYIVGLLGIIIYIWYLAVKGIK
jgi:hypothetical protein